MAIDLVGKPIAITGASSGIGAATALACAAAGMPVALAARREDKLRLVADRINAEGGRAIWFKLDVCDPGQSEAFIDRTVAEFGSIYSVFANAGYGLEAAMHEMPDKQLREIFECNFFGTINTFRPAIPRMIEAKAGHILICSSCVAKMSLPFYGAYSATKAAQNHIGRAMNLELRPHGIRVSTVHPVGTRTEFFDTVQHLNGGMKLVEHTPDFFLQKPERVAKAIVRCLRRPRAEVWTSRFVRLGMAFCNAFPGIEDLAVAKMVDKRLRRKAEADRRAAADQARPAGGDQSRMPA